MPSEGAFFPACTCTCVLSVFMGACQGNVSECVHVHLGECQVNVSAPFWACTCTCVLSVCMYVHLGECQGKHLNSRHAFLDFLPLLFATAFPLQRSIRTHASPLLLYIYHTDLSSHTLCCHTGLPLLLHTCTRTSPLLLCTHLLSCAAEITMQASVFVTVYAHRPPPSLSLSLSLSLFPCVCHVAWKPA